MTAAQSVELEIPTTFESCGETVTVKRLASGYFHLRGVGPCNWAQPRQWPCEDETLEAAFFGEASLRFRQAVRLKNWQLKAERDSCTCSPSKTYIDGNCPVHA